MKYPSIIGLTAALVCYVDLAVAKTPAEIKSISQAVTVEIRLLQAETVGSGIIIDRQGDSYTLITNRHVVCGRTRNCTTPPPGETYTLKLGDRQEYKVAAKSVKLLGNNLDLAIVQFRSNRAHPVAQFATPGSLKVGDPVYTSGYPAELLGFSFNAGSAIAVVDRRLTEDRGGYTVIYNAATQPGMSGGGVFSQSGQLVAIHGQGERYRDNTELATVSPSGINTTGEEVGSKIGLNRGIPVRWVVSGLADRGIGLGNGRSDNLTQTAASSADEHFIAGFNKVVEPGTDVVTGKRLALNEFSRAIEINPGYIYAYFMRAYTYSQLQEQRRAIAEYNRVIALDPKVLNAYFNRGILKEDLNDPQGALADYDLAIAIDSNDPKVYNNRGILKADKLNDSQGALADYNRAIAIDPKSVPAYYNRGRLKADKLNDSQGALTDYDRAIVLNPQLAIAYNNRGILKADKLNDSQGALADYNRAIEIDPQLILAYGGRGLLKYTKLGSRSGGIADLRQAAKLARSQGNSGLLKLAIETLQSWGVGE
jgi:tetratricopeptide (TPR) repeat protein